MTRDAKSGEFSTGIAGTSPKVPKNGCGFGTLFAPNPTFSGGKSANLRSYSTLLVWVLLRIGQKGSGDVHCYPRHLRTRICCLGDIWR